MLAEFWNDVLRQRRFTNLLGERLAAARRTWERRWGCHNLEVPISRLCRTESFAWFACHLLNDLPRFHALYNNAVHAYRRAHGIRNRQHPVPDLGSNGVWLETPFWIWTQEHARRERLFARLAAGSLELASWTVDRGPWTDGSRSTVHGLRSTIQLPRPNVAPEQVVAAWLDLERRGIKIRTRALTTTMYAHLFLGDTFIHGIGGAKYDELTDVLIRQFFGIEPPRYLVLSATLLLPFAMSAVADGDVRLLAARRRDCWWNPQRHLEAADGPVRELHGQTSEVFKTSEFFHAAVRDLAERKQILIQKSCADHAQRRERFLELRRLGADLRAFAQTDLHALDNALTQARHNWQKSNA